MRLAAWALLLGSCGQAPESATPCLSEDLFALAARHYRAHNSTDTVKLSGGRLAYVISDEGASWAVSVSPQGYAGGDTMMSIRKSDMQVEVSPIRGQ